MTTKQAAWSRKIIESLSTANIATPAKQAALLKRGIALLAHEASRVPKQPLVLPEQPFDSHLLALSPMYRKSRKLFREMGGTFKATLVTSPRSLGSAALLSPVIEYSPIERELIWAATDPLESRNSEHLFSVRTYASSLFHEQNHRILWKLLPSVPKRTDAISRYLNFAESLVIVMDMALGDEIGPELSRVFHLSGVTYDMGTKVLKEIRCDGEQKTSGISVRRIYRNYLQAALHATYLNLEMYESRDIPRVISALFPGLGELAERAARRSGNLDRQFISRTNLIWQQKNIKEVRRILTRKDLPSLKLSDDPLDNRLQYLFAEKWFEAMGL